MKQDREAIRILVADIGYTEAAIRTGLKRDRLYKWGQRYGWKEPVQHAQGIVQSVQSPAIAHAQALQEYEGKTRLSLAKSAANMAKDCEELPARHAKIAHTVAQTMAIVHKQGEHGNQQGFTLNVLNMGSLEVTVSDPDAQP